MTTHVVPDDTLGMIARRWWEVERRVMEGTLDPSVVARSLQSIVEAKNLTDTPALVADCQIPGLFIPPAEQLRIARQRNTERGWGFTDADFAAIGKPPAWPEGALTAVVLDVSLDTVQQTFEEAWNATASAQPDSWRWNKVKSDPDHLRLLPGIAHRRGLRWRVVDLAANWDRKKGMRPVDVCHPATSPSSAVLWAASYFPKWIQAMDGTTVPYVWIPGYQVDAPGYGRWAGVPLLSWVRVSRKVRLYAFDSHNQYGPQGGACVPGVNWH